MAEILMSIGSNTPFGYRGVPSSLKNKLFLSVSDPILLDFGSKFFSNFYVTLKRLTSLCKLLSRFQNSNFPPNGGFAKFEIYTKSYLIYQGILGYKYDSWRIPRFGVTGAYVSKCRDFTNKNQRSEKIRPPDLGHKIPYFSTCKGQ